MFSFVYKDIDFAHKYDEPNSDSEQYGKHMHPFVEILYFISGNISYVVENEKRKMKPGDMIYIQPGKFHFADIDQKIGYERYVLKFPETLIPNHIKNNLKHRSCFFHLNSEQINLFKTIEHYSLVMKKEDMYLICLAKLYELFALIDNSHQFIETKGKENTLNRIIEHIENHLEENINLTSISNDLNISESHICNIFKKEMHISIMRYIRSKKIIHAHSLIQAGQKPLDVCALMNFNDYSTFYRQYLKVIGMSPSKDK